MTCPPVWWASSGARRDPSAVHVILIHGSLDRSAGLLKLSRRLDRRFAVTRYDRRGYGRSRPCDGPFGMSGQVDDVVDLISAAEIRSPCVVVGHSYGGNVALALAERRPESVAAVVTYESPLSWLEWWPGRSAGGDAMAWRDDPEEAAEQFMRRLIGDERWERLPPSSRAARRAEGPALIGELADLRASAPWSADRIDVPVLAVYGEHGRDHHRRAMHHLGEHLAQVEVTEMRGAGHFGPNSHPDDMAMLVERFVGVSG